jgi:hypothetical protein
MANEGIRGYYKLTEVIKEELLKEKNINTVTTGDITDINLYKQDIFPIGHIIVNNVTDQENVLMFSLSILACDVVNQSKELTYDRFTGNNNLQDILNTQLAVLNRLIQRLRKGTLYTEQYQLEGSPTLQPFYDRFDNQLAGWTADINVMIYNDIYIC